jgi:acyl carrier protein
MNCQMLDPRLIELISDVFGIPEQEVTPESSSDTVPDWDSVGHLRLIMRLEETFGVRFPTADIPNLVSALQIQESLNRFGIGTK